jgi:hypothetical protein
VEHFYGAASSRGHWRTGKAARCTFSHHHIGAPHQCGVRHSVIPENIFYKQLLNNPIQLAL